MVASSSSLEVKIRRCSAHKLNSNRRCQEVKHRQRLCDINSKQLLLLNTESSSSVPLKPCFRLSFLIIIVMVLTNSWMTTTTILCTTDAFSITTTTFSPRTRTNHPTTTEHNRIHSSIRINPFQRKSLQVLFQSSPQQQQQSSVASSFVGQPPALSIDKITCSYDGGKTYQLNDASYILQRSSKVALVGRNGAGKSTLLRILAQNAISSTTSNVDNNNNDDIIKYSGSVTCPRNLRISYVEQEPLMESDVTVAEALLGITSTSNDNSDKSVYGAVRRYRFAAVHANENRKYIYNYTGT